MPHEHYEHQHLIRNCTPQEALNNMKKLRILNGLEKERKQRDPNFKGFCSNITNEFMIMYHKLKKNLSHRENHLAK